MDKNAIKKYAVWARRELISRVTQRAEKYGVMEDGWGNINAENVNGRVLSETEKSQRIAFIKRVQSEGYEQAIEEVAYTWFNRFCALRYMEVNAYLPSHVRVFTNDAGEFKPQILDEALHLDLDGLDMEKVLKLKENADQTEDLFRYLLITQCNALSSILPGMFQKIEDYTELLLPDNLLREGSVIDCLIAEIPEEDWTDQVQIIGWLYQYYNAEKKDEVFAALKKNVKVSKENIPAATQLFTPDWIVRYMVENSLGRLWLEGHPNDRERFIAEKKEDGSGGKQEAEWKYYLDGAEQEPEVEAQLSEIRKEYSALKPEEILCIDPCAGSGHIICYLFDILLQIYESYGYTTTEAVSSIVENNLYGLDIDERAAQLAYFSVMMKARNHDRRFFSRGIQPHVYAIRESNGLSGQWAMDSGQELTTDHSSLITDLFDVMHDAREYGSIITVPEMDFDALRAYVRSRVESITQYDMESQRLTEELPQVLELINVAEVLAQKYDVVVTNPPYMGGGNMGTKLSQFVKKNYPDSKSDMSTVCMEKTMQMCKENGYMAMINIPVWMFLSSYEKLRTELFANNTITSMVHPGRGIFGSDFGTTTFVFCKARMGDYRGTYYRLFDQQGEVKSPEEREQAFLDGKGHYISQQSNFSKIPGSPVAYWCSQAMLNIFVTGQKFEEVAAARKGLVTGNDNLYLKFWHEIDKTDLSIFAGWSTKWKPLNKGGSFRKWYGNNEYVVNWGTDGAELANHRWPDGRQRSSLRNSSFFFKEGITWTYITSGTNCFRYYPDGFAFAGVGPGLFPKNRDNLLMMLSYCNSIVFREVEKMIGASTISLESGEVEKSPIIIPQDHLKIDELTKESICISKQDWDSYETSWDFVRHPLVRSMPTVAEAFAAWEEECNVRFSLLKSNEEELNRIFIDIYGLQEELTPEVEEKDVTVRRADLQRDIKSLISYAVGCMFGRYSLDVDGLVYAGGNFDESYCRWIRQFGSEADRYIDAQGKLKEGAAWTGANLWEYDGIRKDGHWVKAAYAPDTSGILPICDDEYFTDDIVGHFVDFIRTVYGEDTLEENLQFIAYALGGTGSSREVIRKYFLNDFYKDHCKTYQKRPIYWLFDSGKKNGFKCLIYLHRYRPDTIARIRTDYVHEQQARYRTAIADLEHRMDKASTSERIKQNKQLKKLQDQADELHDYEEKIHHLADQFIDMDLDDGIKVNYAKFQEVLAKIK